MFAPDDVWVFGLDADAYAAHYDGRGWAKVRLPAAPDEVARSAPTTSGPCTRNVAWYWNGGKWTANKIPNAAGNPPESFDHLTVTGPRSAWVWRTVLVPAPGRSRPAALERHVVAAGRGTPADLIDSVAPDGSGGLWATGWTPTPAASTSFTT